MINVIENTETKKSRNIHIDIMKGIGIILVVFAHTCEYRGAIYLFHMPLFFMLSGAVLVYAKHDYSLVKRFEGIMVPYFVFSLLWFAYWGLIEARLRPVHDVDLFSGVFGTLDVKWQQFVNIFVAKNGPEAFLYNVVLWFLPCLFAADWIYAQLRKSKYAWALVATSAILYYVLFAKLPSLPWCLNTAVLSVSLLFIGHKTYSWLYHTASRYGAIVNLIATVLLASVFVAIAEICNIRLDMKAGIIPPFYGFYGMAMLGSLIVFGIAVVLDKASIVGGVIAWIGRNSLIVMCMHEPIKRVMKVVISKLFSVPVDYLGYSVSLSMLCTIVVVALCMCCAYVINKRLPWVIGKF